MNDSLPPIRTGPPTREEFDTLYGTPPPWDIGRPQPAFAALADTGRLAGRVLDAGCGTGEHTLMAARLGLVSVGVDAAPSAIALAGAKAAGTGLPVRFTVGDARALGDLGEEPFDTVLDSGLFHVFDDADRVAYVASLHSVLSPGARVFLMCFSEREPGGWGPRRVTEAELRESFATGWRVGSVTPGAFELRGDRPGMPSGAQAHLAEITRA